MTKIYEALEKARMEREQQESHHVTSHSDEPEGSPTSVPVEIQPDLKHALDEKLLALTQRVTALIGRQKGLVVEFTGTQPNSGSSVLAFQFARLAAGCLDKKVLFVSAGQSFRPSNSPNWEKAKAWHEAAPGTVTPDELTFPDSTHPNLYLSRIAPYDAAVSSIVASPAVAGIMDSLRDRFDIVVIDAPPVGATTNAAVLSAITDGVVVVIEAAKTRWQIARAAMELITAHHGRILGVVLNKQPHPVPDFVYSKL